jgi:uncharacterized protein YkwD
MIAAIAAGVLAVFGVSAIALPAIFADDPKSASSNTAGALPPPVTSSPEASAAPTAPPSATPSPTPSRSTASPTPAASITFDAQLEAQMIGLVNNVRKQARCPGVRAAGNLRSAARAHSADMATNNFVSHQGSDGSSPESRMRAAGVGNPLGENVAKGGDAEQVMRSWLRDRGARANLLDCSAKFIGVGVALKGRTPYWTQNFSR